MKDDRLTQGVFQGVFQGLRGVDDLTYDLDIVISVEEEVLGLDISVHDEVGMAIGNGGQDLSEEPPGLPLAQLPVGHDVVEHLSSVRQLHGEVDEALVVDHVVELDYVRVVEQLQHPDLPLQAPHLLLRLDLLLLNHLDRHLLVRVDVSPQFHLSKAALPEGSLNTIWSNLLHFSHSHGTQYDGGEEK